MIEIRNVTKRYGDFTAIEDISFSTPPCSITGLVGYNGAGKTTLIKIAAGIYKPENGTALLSGEDVFDNNNERKRLFYVPDELYFPASSTLKTMSAYYKGYYPNFDMKVFNKLTKLFSLDTATRIKSFSKGMQRQSEIILALSSMPKYMLLDETFDGLDPQKRDLTKKLLLEYMAESSCSLIISSHNLSELANLCDRVCLINGKRLVINSLTEDLGLNIRKVRIILAKEVQKDMFSPLSIEKLKTQGTSALFVLRGDINEGIKYLNSLNPVSLETFEMTLEEIFLNEMEDDSLEVQGFFDKE
ncbi:MAG: ABC transporter ATP-binding protein [Acutalibacteraceae bacterium]